MLKNVYDSDTLSWIQAFESHRSLREGPGNVQENELSGLLQISRTSENIKKVSAIVRKSRSLLATDFLVKTKTTVLPHPPYSPDLSPQMFHLFSELTRHLQGRLFQSADEFKRALPAELKDRGKIGFQKYFDDLYNR
ncbi:hypothetical protein TNCV_47551 [Trichonephila clavipes]|nr:hypothetical protein TNCV_47551 [Trichonephila clavipes]